MKSGKVQKRKTRRNKRSNRRRRRRTGALLFLSLSLYLTLCLCIRPSTMSIHHRACVCVCALCSEALAHVRYQMLCNSSRKSLWKGKARDGMGWEGKGHGKSIGQTDKSCGTGAVRNKNKIQKEQRKEDALLFSLCCCCCCRCCYLTLIPTMIRGSARGECKGGGVDRRRIGRGRNISYHLDQKGKKKTER